ncbi:MAG: hypothetical protein MJK18_09905, partial [Bdellovibrionales bacterium]|nr:hypothetical protein [Bdellovibrionales bacterium]
MLVELLEHSLNSLSRVFIGWLFGVSLGVFLGLMRARLPQWLQRNFIFNFVVEAPRFPPPIAWIPFIILLLGVSE